jgi:hypothetical protein
MSVRVFISLAAASALLAGCRAVPPSVRRTLATPYKPANLYVRQPRLPDAIRRVAVLPLPASRVDANQAAGAAMLGPVLFAELARRNAFEVIPVSTEQASQASGGSGWSADCALPNDFFDNLSRQTGCDAVLFTSLTVFQAYPPLRTGWKARLVDCRQHQTWWAVDEVFDAGSNPVAAAAEAFARDDMNLPDTLLTDSGVLQSPVRFGQYTANAVAGTIPAR